MALDAVYISLPCLTREMGDAGLHAAWDCIEAQAVEIRFRHNEGAAFKRLSRTICGSDTGRLLRRVDLKDSLEQQQQRSDAAGYGGGESDGARQRGQRTRSGGMPGIVPSA
jgi:hypothetical protein